MAGSKQLTFSNFSFFLIFRLLQVYLENFTRILREHSILNYSYFFTNMAQFFSNIQVQDSRTFTVSVTMSQHHLLWKIWTVLQNFQLFSITLRRIEKFSFANSTDDPFASSTNWKLFEIAVKYIYIMIVEREAKFVLNLDFRLFLFFISLLTWTSFFSHRVSDE